MCLVMKFAEYAESPLMGPALYANFQEINVQLVSLFFFCFVILSSHVGHVLTFCPAIGSCHHSFHMHCILKWLDTDTSKGLCPMCRQIFTLENSNNKEVFEALSGRPSPLEEGILEQEETPV
ncbi:BA75_00310T0 [Komagataella pastoris]|uniref:Anaphase-promoting complex subunit 11 n=1 Tax=Komagataella pastoris TaxID=4922 RepID=A0A1B2J7I3_PICPA|nr:BA75_00310T0 [Komagataella pastoris]